MATYYTDKEAAERIGIGVATLYRWQAAKKVKLPSVYKGRLWTADDIARVKAQVEGLRYRRMKE